MDDLDDFIAARTKKNAAFPELVAEAEARRRIAQELAAARKEQRLSQKAVAASMATTQSVVSKLERGGDVKLSTLLRYADTVGAHLVVAARTPRRRKPTSG